MVSLVNTKLIVEAAQHTDWYIRLEEHLAELKEIANKHPETGRQITEELRDAFEDLIAEDKLALGISNPELDSERLPIDSIVIHHTSQNPGITLMRLNVIQLLNIYMPVYLDPKQGVRGGAITSNHIYDGKPVFWGYHWLLRMDGSAERILPDSALGWHAANWDINRRSVGICLDNDYEDQDPSPEILRSLASLIAKEYSRIAPERIFGHCEVSRTSTMCPGSNFASWKQQLSDIRDFDL